ncbi:hypothetical protein BS50DRAFT_563610 [Corynespora cassiicola Philippines]|uniref:Mid2 domain-containing protein n=1 Tax=Corynespora cassiicola Philippines TaxID=1448308 RepID=A0A2T2N4Z3_CORCC|nr:hypothetical protein BS50DRAFT_563610 [Corynespora cassiicola Philippines]
MARLATFASIAWLLTGTSCLMEFINPPPFGKTGDFSGNPIYAEGSTVNIAWTEGEEKKGASLVLYQLNETDSQWFGDMEYLTQGAVGVTRYSWLVGTRKDLSVSNLFYLSIFQEGKGASDSNSRYFNIEAKGVKEQSTSSSLTLPSSSPSAAYNVSFTTSLSASASTSNEPPSLSPTRESTSVPSSSIQSSASPSSSSSFPMGAKIGIGVGIPVALFLCLGAGFFLSRRRRKRGNIATVVPPYPHIDYRHHNGSYYGSNLNEAPQKSPVEIGQLRDSYVAYHTRQVKQDMGTNAETVRYEM